MASVHESLEIFPGSVLPLVRNVSVDSSEDIPSAGQCRASGARSRAQESLDRFSERLRIGIIPGSLASGLEKSQEGEDPFAGEGHQQAGGHG